MFLEYQLNYLLWLQNLREISGGIFDDFFLAITNFGDILIPFIVMSVIYWALNKKVGEFLITAHAFMFSSNQLFKMIACINRPWILTDKIKPVKDAIPAATGFSFPSGHTACATAVWGGLSTIFWNNKILRYTFISLILIIAFSRNYLGVHTPQDVIVSLIAGVVILFLLNKIFFKIDQNKIFISGILFVIFIITFVILKYKFLTGSAQYFDYVSQMPSVYANLGYALGALCGLLACKNLVKFSTDNLSWSKRLTRASIGVVILITLILFTSPAFVEYFGECKGSFIYAYVVGIFMTFLYPWIFTRFENRFNEHLQENR